MLDAALLAMSRLAVIAPPPLGVNATSTVQVSLAARCAPEQVSPDSANSPGLVPPSDALVIVSVASPVLVIANVCAAPVVPTR